MTTRPPRRGPETEPPGALLGRSWGGLGRSSGRLGTLLGPSWGLLGPSWNQLEAPQAHRTRKSENAKDIENTRKGFEGFWPLGDLLGRRAGHLEPSRGGLEGSWMHLESYLEPSWAILRDLGGHLGLCGAVLEPPRAILGALPARGAPRADPGGTSSSDHSRQKGLVGSLIGLHGSSAWVWNVVLSRIRVLLISESELKLYLDTGAEAWASCPGQCMEHLGHGTSFSDAVGFLGARAAQEVTHF